MYLVFGDTAEADSDRVVLDKGGEVSTETYFGCYYLSYWTRFARLGRVGVCIRLAGCAVVRVYLRRPEAPDEAASKQLLCEQKVAVADAADAKVVWLDAVDGAAADGRIFVELEAAETTEIHTLSYVTDAPPQREVRLSVGICTFRREAQLSLLLSEMRDQAGRCPAIERIFVVNQGGPFELEELNGQFADPQLVLIEQDNLGGCGGFNRTLYEAVERSEGITHHLLMDDDVEIDARVIDTAVAFLSYMEKDVVVGGHMLSATAPDTLLEAGAVFDPIWFVNPLGKDTNVGQASGLSIFDRCSAPAYNGWWFCILPVSSMREAGYSPPIFIRCDDMEMGCRLGKQGAPTVSLPGVAVWHELNYSHTSDWDQYYDIRNRLILSSLHGDLTPPPAASFVFGYVLECLLTHRFAAAKMCMLGVSDFLLGPDDLFATSAAHRHGSVVAMSKRDDRKALSKSQALSHEWGTAIERPRKLGANARAYLGRLFAALFLPHDTGQVRIYRYRHVNPMTVGNRSYILTDERQQAFVLHEPKRGKFVSILLSSIVLATRYFLGRRRVGAAWRAKVSRYQTSEYWQKLFGPV